ncbi:zinc finger FYVE domain-containing protein 9 [Neocloeon triangulifer]|uniref:zinc finger FYVE domain-containing protein 9 n=1 Tax=Neocloeon triangulifer TaxID=2078957 RepID=UPI00286F04C2|nr:zinc finger FYVE domain-containing protein 9 [Neocloeon triangulifer]XP_059491178.1 zinc finger FYVE domain-containing protein 9 [Neocloeon triangulifer]XP_059491179.1 zinc finger FYVE domain-containing protein 9 [Neocloeon triangulifer]
MEKFTVDLDKVLDDFEGTEEGQEEPCLIEQDKNKVLPDRVVEEQDSKPDLIAPFEGGVGGLPDVCKDDGPKEELRESGDLLSLEVEEEMDTTSSPSSSSSEETFAEVPAAPEALVEDELIVIPSVQPVIELQEAPQVEELVIQDEATEPEPVVEEKEAPPQVVSFNVPVNISDAELEEMLDSLEETEPPQTNEEEVMEVAICEAEQVEPDVSAEKSELPDESEAAGDEFEPASEEMETETGSSDQSPAFVQREAAEVVENLRDEERRGSAVRPQSLQLNEEDGQQHLVTVGPPGNTPGTSAFPSPPNSPGSSSPRPSLMQTLGQMAPYWIPDAEAPVCMHCESKFTMIKRRHHCRACGKVLCSRCCNSKAKLKYLENTEARVCQSCYPILKAAEDDSSPSARSPNPNNPMEYCSTVSPLQQVAANQRPPSVMVPVGVLKDKNKPRGEPKQVVFSDGVRPGGERTNRTSPEKRGAEALVPPDLASYTLLSDSSFEEDKVLSAIRNEADPPVVFALGKNLFVLVKIVNLNCCVHRTVWCLTTRGLRCEGQDEMVFIVEARPDDRLPRDIFAHILRVHSEASRGNTVTEMGHSTLSGQLGGFLYIRPTTQCLQRLVLPPPPFLVALLLQKWEVPWARLFPLRLVLRLGYEFRYYPCPLFSLRERQPVFCEVGQTILDLLADFRNFTYTLPCIQGLVIHMEDKKTSLLIPRNRYDQVARVLSNANDHVLALGASFSRDADSHLVCVQGEDEAYTSKAISIQNTSRKTTGASFIVFNGALKTSAGLSAKSSIVEDGLMVQVLSDTMQALCNSLREMKDFVIACGPAGAETETINIQWVKEDRYFNVGVSSQVDGAKLEGVPSIRVHNGTDYRGERCFIRWTEVFLLKVSEDVGAARGDLDISRVSGNVARAFCVALVPLLDMLAAAGLLILAVRITLNPEQVGYEAGSGGEKLPPIYMQSLDDELVPVIHQAASQVVEGSTVLELVFSVMRH